MKQIAAPLRVLALLVSAIVWTTAIAHAQTYSLLQWIDTQEEGYNPNGALILASDGNLYGTMRNGGAGFDGTVFRITPAGALTTIHTFVATTSTVGYRPQAGVVEGADGNLYGMTSEGGTYGEGVIFRMTKAGVATPLYVLRLSTTTPSGALASLVLATDGNFYGIGSAWDGTYFGKVFRMTPAGVVTVLHRFSGADGAYPASSGLIQGSDGFLYGTTEGGGAADAGTIFKDQPGRRADHRPFLRWHDRGQTQVRADSRDRRQLLRRHVAGNAVGRRLGASHDLQDDRRRNGEHALHVSRYRARRT